MEIKCPYFSLCGGCNKLDKSYEEEIKEKEEYIKKLFASIGYKKPIEVVSADDPYHYRNKNQIAFQNIK
jgi:23S rRNA (uracil1939-C5)-methyltransferase